MSSSINLIPDPSINLIPDLYYAERYRNKDTRTYSTCSEYTDAKPGYRPDGSNPQFNVRVFRLPMEEVDIFMANPNKDILAKYIHEDHVLVLIHPQVFEGFPNEPYLQTAIRTGIEDTSLQVIPSSSTRTLFVDGSQPFHAVKVHFPFKVSRYGRKMRSEVVEQAINVSKELEANIHKLDSRFAFLREVLGVAFKQKKDEQSKRGENWGYVVRDMTPFPPAPGQRKLVPGFSLYGKDYFDDQTQPLLVDLIEKQKVDPAQFVLENIMLPILRHWVGCFLNFGYLIEPHGQNVLIEFDENDQITRIVHRDLSVGIDMKRRKEVGFSDEELNNYNRMKHNSFHSITFDKFMGGHFFNNLANLLQEKYGVSHDVLHEACKDEFLRVFPNHEEYMPKTVHYFSEEYDQYGKPLYKDTGVKPTWRP